MYETSEQRVEALKNGVDIVDIESIYIQSNCIKIVRPNILKPIE